MQELQQTLKQSQESGTKLRKALHKMKETISSNEQNHVQESGEYRTGLAYLSERTTLVVSTEVRFRILTEEYEEKLKEQEADYSAKMKAMSKDMHVHLEEKERLFNEQLHQLIGRIEHVDERWPLSFRVDKSYQNENDLKEQIIDAQQQALTTAVPPIQVSTSASIVAPRESNAGRVQDPECDHHVIVQELEDRIVELQSHIETLSNQKKTPAQ